MAFRFTEEDFERYVTMDEHGGRHIWHYLEDRLKELLGVAFKTNPFVARGDRLQHLWIVPRDTPRLDWRHQAMFHLARSLEEDHLTFGLAIECPPLPWAEEQDLDLDRDGMRVIQRLNENPDFQATINELAGSPRWRVGLSTNGTAESAASAEELLDAIRRLPKEEYWTAYCHRRMDAEEVIKAAEKIVDIIMEAYETVLPLWLAVIPEADRDCVLKEQGDLPSLWWVNQGDSHQYAIADEYLWAPLETEQGRSLVHWELLSQVEPGDVVVHYYHQAVRGLSRVKNGPKIAPDPQQDPEQDRDEGRLVDVEYFEFDDPIPFDSVRENVTRLKIDDSPFTEGCNVKQGYFWRFSREGLAILRHAYQGSWPSWAEDVLPITDLRSAESKTQYLVSFDLRRLLKGALSARGLRYSDWQVATFYTALQTKGFVILSGISGTGKTKLAQAFAEILPQPTTPPTEARDDLISITVQPYMPKYNRFIIPKQFTKLYDPPERGESKEVELTYDGQSQTCRLAYHDYTNTNYIALYLKGDAGSWFSEAFQVGDTAVLEPRSDKEGGLIGFRLGKPSDPAFGEQTSGSEASNSLFVPVRTDWRDSKSLLGYYNPLTGTYEWTTFLRFLLRAVQSYRQGDSLAWFVILDEMNLARVEYYFADLLSVLESGRDADGWTQEALRLPYPNDAEGDLPPSEVKVPPNFYVIGTVNVDETTHTFSPKVLDRAFTLELTEADFNEYPPDPSDLPDGQIDSAERRAVLSSFGRQGQFIRIDKPAIASYVEEKGEVREHLQRLNDQLRPYQLHFGYRVFDEIVSFLISARKNQLYVDMDGAFDAAVLMKVLPKFHGSRAKLEEPLKRVLAWCLLPNAPDYETIDEALKGQEDTDAAIRALEDQSYRYGRTAAKARRMSRELYTSGFASFS